MITEEDVKQQEINKKLFEEFVRCEELDMPLTAERYNQIIKTGRLK